MNFNKVLTIMKLTISIPLFLVIINVTYAFKDDTTVRIGIYDNNPLVFRNTNDEPQGLFIDIIKNIASQEGWKPIFIYDSFRNCIKRLRNNEIDLIAAIAHTENREKYFDFSQETVCTLWGTVYVHPSSKIQSVLDLKNKKIAVMNKGIYGEKIKKICNDFDISCDFIKTSSQHESLLMLKEKKVDAAIFNNAFKEIYDESVIKKTSIIFSPLKIVFATSKNNNLHLLNTIDTKLKKWKDEKDPLYYKALNRWLGVIEISKKYIPKWLVYGFLVTISIIIISLFWVISLRFQISERAKAEKALHESENRFRSLSDASYEGILITDKGTILEANKTMSEIFGYQTVKLMKMKATDLVVPENREEVRNKILTGYEKPYEINGLKEDGTIFPIEVRAKMFEYKGRQRRVASVRDLTEQKKAEEEIKHLRGILPLCSFCKKIRDDKGYWEQVDTYIHKYSQANISHSICPDCKKKHYPELEDI